MRLSPLFTLSTLFVTGIHAFSPSSLVHNHNRIGTFGITQKVAPLFASNDNNDKNNMNIVSSSSSQPKEELSRREAMSQSASSLLSLFLLSSTAAATTTTIFNPTPALALEDDSPSSSSSTQKTILITGCNSGIGYEAALRMAKSCSSTQNYKIILACRTLSKAQDTASRIISEVGPATFTSNYCTLIPAECDLANLSSINSFVNDFVKNDANNIGTLDVVCLNAGLALDTSAKEVARTKDGFELTVGTNHFGHFYLNSLLLPLVNSQTGRIVVTASGVHDPDSPGGAQGSKATLGKLKGLDDAASNNSKFFDMVDGGSYDADKAYKDSKLCNVLFTRELQKRLNVANSGIKAYCFNPGLIVGTGFFRNQNPLFTKVFDVAATNIFKVGETPGWGGGSLEYMALNPNIGGPSNQGGLYYTAPPGSSKYGDAAFGREFTITQVSKEASDDEKAKKLWSLSEKLVGISS